MEYHQFWDFEAASVSDLLEMGLRAQKNAKRKNFKGKTPIGLQAPEDLPMCDLKLPSPPPTHVKGRESQKKEAGQLQIGRWKV